MLQQENSLAKILIPSGKITAETLNSVMNEDIILPYETCQKLIDQGFISEEDLLKILGKYFNMPYSKWVLNQKLHFMLGIITLPILLAPKALDCKLSSSIR